MKLGRLTDVQVETACEKTGILGRGSIVTKKCPVFQTETYERERHEYFQENPGVSLA